MKESVISCGNQIVHLKTFGVHTENFNCNKCNVKIDADVSKTILLKNVCKIHKNKCFFQIQSFHIPKDIIDVDDKFYCIKCYRRLKTQKDLDEIIV